MNFFLEYGTIITIACFLLFFFIEQYRKRFIIPCTIDDGGLKRWTRNITFGVINRALAPFILVPLAMYVAKINLWQRPEFLLHCNASIIIDILILDFACYIFHRLCHKTPVLWRLHEVHHLDEAFDSTTGLRVHFIELMCQNAFTAIPTILLVIPTSSILLYTSTLGIFAFIQHSNIRFSQKTENVMSLFLVTPKLHTVHHHALIKDTDSNYGFIFSWWDRLFNTFNTSKREVHWRMGLEYSPDLSCLKLLAYPFISRPLQSHESFSEEQASE